MFKKICCVTMSAVFLLGATGCSSKSNRRAKRRAPVAFEKWTEFKAPDNTFVATLPKAPKEAVASGKTTETKSYTALNKGEAYFVSCSTIKDDSVAAARDADVKAAERRANILSTTQKDITFCGEGAREMTWDADGYHYRGVVLKTHEGHHMYTLWARWKDKEPANASKFFSAFKPGPYTPKPKPTVTPTPDEDESATPSASFDESEEMPKVEDDSEESEE